MLTRETDVRQRFADDDDLLRYESTLDEGEGKGVWPRKTKQGHEWHGWAKYHLEAMNELDRRLRARKGQAEQFEIGRLSMRSRDRLRPVAAFLALHFLFVDADQNNDQRLANKASYYWERAASVLEAECTSGLDYDSDRSGTFDQAEKEQPFPTRLIRG